VAALALFAAFIALAAAVETGATDAADAWLRASIHASSSPSLTSAMIALTRAGSAAALTALFAIAAGVFYLAGRRRSMELLALAMIGAIVLENALKYAFQRARPEPFFGLVAPETYSFPSGHALFSTCLYGAVAWRLAAGAGRGAARVALACAAAALVATIGYSRIYLGVHYPTDVLAGALVGAAWLSAVALWASRRGVVSAQ
jgi:undecaprenyl-diphosphatase